MNLYLKDTDVKLIAEIILAALSATEAPLDLTTAERARGWELFGIVKAVSGTDVEVSISGDPNRSAYVPPQELVKAQNEITQLNHELERTRKTLAKTTRVVHALRQLNDAMNDLGYDIGG